MLVIALLMSGPALAQLPKVDTTTLKPSDVSQEYCESNANILGYLLTMEYSCGYKLGKQQSNQMSTINKVCIKKLGEDHISNVTLSGIHEAKNDLANHEHSDVCRGIYKSYKEFYN